MHNNYYLFKLQVAELKPQICGSTINKAFTFRKDEIVFELKKDEVQYLYFGINAANPYLLLKPSISRKKPFIELFAGLSGQSIKDIFIIPFDKTVYLDLDDYIVNAVFFGRGANLYLKDKAGGFVDSFKKNIHEITYEFKEQKDFTAVSKIDLQQLINHNKGETLKKFLQNNFGAINNILLDEICRRSGTAKTINIEPHPQFTDKLFSAFQSLSKEFHDNNFYIYSTISGPKITPFKFADLSEESAKYEKFDSLNKAWDYFIYKNTIQREINREKNICLSAIQRRKKYLQRVIEQIEYNKDIEKKHKEAVLKGNLLITNKIRIKPYISKVTLKNIYSDTLEDIEIKLNPKKTVVENANIYFNKYKDIAGIKEKWEVRKQTVTAELKDIIKLENDIEKTYDINKINRFKDQLAAMHILQGGYSKNTQVQNLLKYSFNRMILENTWEIFIGKNGKNNDLLTFTFAHKWDIWMHAQGVPGSHLIIRIPNKNSNPPRSVIEKAAQMAAYHSKAQHSGLVPVIYTYVKYVHRVRKADPGTVSVQNEKVIFVKPVNINH